MNKKKDRTEKLVAYFVSDEPAGRKSGPMALEIYHKGDGSDNSSDYLSHIIKADYFDVITRYIDGEAYDFVIDDEGHLCRKATTATTINGERYENIAGCVLIFGKTDRGGWKSLEKADVERIEKSFVGSLLYYSL